MNAPAFPQPPLWQRSLAQQLHRQLVGSSVEGIVGGSRWLSLRIGGSFLWIVVQSPLRMAWLDTRPVPGSWFEALGRHKDSPFATHLRDQELRAVDILQSGGEDVGLRWSFSGGVSLSMRTWPKPGAIWARGKNDTVLAQSGAMPDDVGNAESVSDESCADAAPIDLEQHASLARAVLEDRLETRVRRRLNDVARSTKRRADGALKALEKEAREAGRAEELRALGDLLAANLHKVRRSQKQIVLPGFDGKPVTIPLDPKLSPGDNLQRLYKRAGKADRKGPAVEVRRETALAEAKQAEDELAAVAATTSLDELIELAKRWHVDVAPVEAGQPRSAPRPPAPRLPYKRFQLASGREVWVGKSAKDNDELSLRRGSKDDLWLHAQSVEGSHVVLRTGGEAVPRDDILQAAQLAALYSKARHASTVPVVVTEKRYVRKPRKSPPGTVIAERTKTEFVAPEMPEGCRNLAAAE